MQLQIIFFHIKQPHCYSVPTEISIIQTCSPLPSDLVVVGEKKSHSSQKRQASIKHRWPTGDMKTQALCLMSSSVIPSLVETVAFGNLRKKWAAPSRSSVCARLVPTQARKFVSSHMPRGPRQNKSKVSYSECRRQIPWRPLPSLWLGVPSARDQIYIKKVS